MQMALYKKQMEVFEMQKKLMEIQMKYYTAKLETLNKQNEKWFGLFFCTKIN